MNFNYIISKLSPSAIERAFEIYWENRDLSILLGINWFKELKEDLMEKVEKIG